MTKLEKAVRMAISRVVAIAIVVIIVVAAVAGVYLYTLLTSQKIPQMTLAPTSYEVIQGEPINFTFYNLIPNTIIVLHTGDGNTKNVTATSSQASIVYTYQNGGHYLVYADEIQNGKIINSTFNSLIQIIVTPTLNKDISDKVSIPTIGFNTTKNPDAPIVPVNNTVISYEENPMIGGAGDSLFYWWVKG
jgi:hypothetical protein